MIRIKRLCLAMIAVLWCSITVNAYDFVVDGICYNIISNNTVEVTQKWDSYSGEIVIPSIVTYGGTSYSVTGIGAQAFLYCSNLTSVIIPNSVTTIGRNAFSDCRGLVSVEMPNSITDLGEFAFSYCESLTSINIPNSITILKSGVFAYCSNLENVKIPNSVTSLGVLGDFTEGPFEGCASLVNIDIPDNVTVIGDCAFNHCTSLVSVTIPSGVTSIGGAAFNCCTSLKSITSLIPAGKIFSTDRGQFDGIDKVNCTLYIPSGTKSTYMSTAGWKDFNSIAEIGHEYDEGKCGDNAYWRLDYNTRTLTISGSGEMYNYDYNTIPWFNDKKSIKNVVIQSGITRIGSYAFFECESLTSVTISGTVTSIGMDAFCACNGLTSVIIPYGVQTIEYFAFEGCKNLISITIPESVKSIQNGAFYGCTSLTSIEIPESVTSIGLQTFEGTAWYDNLPNGEVYVGKVLYCYKGTIPNNSSIQVREGTISISGLAFYGCSGLSSISLPQSLTEIGACAFEDCSSLSSIVIPEKVKSIGDAAFRGCSSLTSITCFAAIPPSTDHSVSISDRSSNIALYVPQSSIERYKTSDGWRNFKSITPIMYNLTYMVDGKKYKTELVAYGSSLAVIDAPTKEGYTFSGFGNLPATMPAHDVTVNAYFTINQYRVTFIVDGVELESKFLEYGSTIKAPNVSNREGYTFSGWSEIPSTMPAKNITISGRFTANKYNLTYMVDGVVHKTLPMTYGSTITPLATPTKVGHTFSGWSEIPSTMPAKDVTISGSFAINSYTLTYTVDGKEYKTETVVYGTELTPLAVPTREGYTFSGWSEIPSTMPAKDVTISGSFAINSYTLTYTVDGKEYKTETVVYGTELTALTAPTKEGHTFSGWSEIPSIMPAKDVTISGSFTINSYTLTYTVDGEAYKTETVVYNTGIVALEEPTKEGYTFSGWSEIPSTMPAKDVTISGSFTINSYTLTYTIDGKEYKTETVVYGTELTALTAPTKEGHTFSGWSEIPSTMPAKDVTISGSFAINSYTLTYTVDGEAYKTETVVYNTGIVALEEPTKEGYTFSGWSEIPSTMPAKDVTISGNFTINSYTLTYTVDGEAYKTETVVYGTKLTVLPEPVKEGYTFSGWSEIPSTMPAKDVTISGNFTINSYTLTYTIDGKEYKTETVVYGTELTALTAPTKEGHTFSGWSEIPSTMPAKNVTISGSFAINSYTLTYTVDGDTVQTDSVVYNTEIVALEEPTKEGHTFSGWSELPDSMPARDITCEGHYTVNTYQVIFSIDGVVLKKYSLEYGAAIVLPSAPEREGYTFSGWEEVPQTVPAYDVTYDANYIANIYMVYYFVGAQLVHSIEVTYGENIPEYVYEPIAEGDVFNGWVGETHSTMPARDLVYTANITNGISLSTLKSQESALIYDLTGRRILNTGDLKVGGIYIINGKKTVIK